MRRFLFSLLALCLAATSIQSQTQAEPVAKPGPTDPVYREIREGASAMDSFAGKMATVKNVNIARDGATFNFVSGEVYFLAPVQGRTIGAVFLGEGELTLAPPSEAEKRHLAIFTGQPVMVDRFTRLVMRFTDQTMQEIERAVGAQISENGPQADRARAAFRDVQSFMRNEVHYNVDLRTLGDVYAPQRPGFFMAFPGGSRFDKLVYVVDPLGIPELAPEQVALFCFTAGEGGVWAAYHMKAEYQEGSANSSADRRLYDLQQHDIDATIRGTRIIATDKLTLQSLASGTRVLPFDLYKTLRVSSVKDEQGNELPFIQENKDDDADFGVILPKPLVKNQVVRLTVEYDGADALQNSGGGNFILLPRSTWYPNNGGTHFGDRALFNLTFHYPKEFTFVGTGAPVGPDVTDGDLKVVQWSSGSTELAVAGFNYGKFIRKDLKDKETGYGLEFYANSEVPDELKDLEMYLEELRKERIYITGLTGKITTSSMAEVALNDTQNATRIYSAYFGRLPYTRIAMTQQPAFNFGQAWPTLIFMPYTAFIDSTQRTQLMGARMGGDKFWKYVGPHEIAHQWWGHIIGWRSYRDQWMSEGFSEFATSLYVQYVRKDMTKFNDYWEAQRKLITEASPQTKNKRPYTVGPLTQGFRLNSGKTGDVARAMIYPKGAYVLHMIRMMMYDHRGGGDARFREMMSEFVKSNFNRDVSTEDFKAAVERFITPQMDVDKNGKMDWFFDAWVYGTDLPSYKLEESSGQGGITLRITQSGVSDNFRMMVPIYVDMGKGWTRLGAAKMVGNTTVEIPNIKLPQPAKRITLCALNDVLYASLDIK
jgi:hypothetical protein